MKEKKSTYQLIIEQISGIFMPVINILTAAGILKSVMILLAQNGILSQQSGIYLIFYGVSDGFFYFLPLFLAITAAKQWKTDLFTALLIPVAMLYPDIVAVLENGGTLPFGPLAIPSTIYHSSVIPVLLAVGLLHFVEIPCDKYIPEAVKGFVKPILCCLVVLPVTFLLFGPMGSWIGNFLTAVFFRIYDWNAVVAGAFMGFFMQPMVVVGAHWSVIPVSINNIAVKGYDVIMPLVCGAVYGQAGAALAVGLRYKKNKEKKRIAFQASFTAVLGVTEPALYGVNLALVKPVVCGCVAGAVGGAVVGAAGTKCMSFAFPSIVTSVAYVGPGFAALLLSMPLCFVIGLALTYLVQRKVPEEQPSADSE